MLIYIVHRHRKTSNALMWVNHPLRVSQPGRLSFSSFRGR